MGFYPIALAQPTAAIPAIGPTYPLTITGVTAATLALPGPSIVPTAGQTYVFAAWGTITTTVDTQTITPLLYLGTTAQVIGSPGALNPSSGAPVIGATIRFTGAVTFLTAAEASTSMQVDLDYFPSTITQGNTTGLPTTAGQLLAFGITPSDNAVSITINGGYWQRVA
jgi:hypothetical protein